MLIKVNELLEHATKNKYGVAAINVMNYETIKCAIEAAEMARVPIIIQFYPGFDTYIPLTHISYMAIDLAKKATVPVAVHLDHSASFEIAVGGIRDGFPSVMVDGSSLPFEENVKLTSDVKKIAAIFDIDIEAELGHVGDASIEDDIVNASKYTDIDQAIEFVERTECDSLAVAVGNAHGAYITEPNLDFDRIKKLREVLDIPLVLHGGSGIPDEQMMEAVNCGMSKFNIATEYFNAMFDALSDKSKEESDRNGFKLMNDVEEPMIAFVTKKIKLLNPNNVTV